MRCNKEWYVCDRCGKEIPEVPERVKFLQMWRPTKIFNLEQETVELQGYVSEQNLISPKILSATITEYYESKNKKIHLCKDCRRDFEKFMKGI